MVSANGLADSTEVSDRGYEIKYPSTTHDDGSPSDDILNDCRRIFNFIEDERHLTAQKLHVSVMERMVEHPGHPAHASPGKASLLKRKKMMKQQKHDDKDFHVIKDYLDARRETLDVLEVREQARSGLDAMNHEPKTHILVPPHQ